MLGADWKTLYFFATTTAVPLLSICSLVPFLGKGFAFVCYKMALMSAMAAFSFRPLYSTTRPSAWNLEGLRAWASSFIMTNNIQYAALSVIFLTGQPVTVVLLPLNICCVYQWATIASKLFVEVSLWTKYGAPLFDKLQENMMQAMVMCATVEISTAFLLIFELFTRSRNPLRLMLYWNFLRMRYRCTDNTVLRIKYTYSNTLFYHAQVWSLLGQKLQPVLGIRFLQPAVNFAKQWFTGRPAQA